MFAIFKKKEKKPNLYKIYLDEYQFDFIINNTKYTPIKLEEDHYTGKKYYVMIPNIDCSIKSIIYKIGYCDCCGQLQKITK